MTSHATPIFMHQAHTGGTTLEDVVRRQYGKWAVLMVYRKSNLAAEYIRMSEAERQRYRAIYGHLFHGFHQHVPGESFYVTFLRDPLERVISSYYYILRTPAAPEHDYYLEHKLTLQDHIRRVPWDGISQIARVIGFEERFDSEYWRGILRPDALETALKNLETFKVIGLVERYDQSLLLMQRELGWQKPIHYLRRNAATSRPRFADLDAVTQEMLLEVTAAERAMYEWAKARFETQIAALGESFQADVARFKAENARYGERVARVEQVKDTLRPAWRRVKRALKG